MCTALVVGAAAGVVFGIDLTLTTAVMIAVLAVTAVWRHGRLVGVASACVGAALGAHARDATLRPVPRDWLMAEPVVRSGVLQSDASRGPAGVRVELRIDGRKVRLTVTGAQAEQEFHTWTTGRVFRAPVRLREPDVVRNPGSPSVTWQRLTARFDVVGSVKSASLVDVEPGSWWSEAAADVRAYIRRTTTEWLTPWSATSQAVVAAILIGDRAGLDDATTRRLQAAGTFHVIAISGGNIAILTMVCVVCGRVLFRAPTGPWVATILVVAAYGLVVDREPSVTRAIVAALIYLALRIGGVSPRPVNLLAVVAAVCVVVDPLTVIDVGAWLSFGATFGLIVILPKLLTVVPDRLSFLRVACLATIAAELVIAPIGIAVFGRLSPAGVLLNLVAIPAMAVAQCAGLLLCVIAPLSPPAAGVIAAVAHGATVVLLGSSALVDVAPWLTWRVPSSSGAWLGAYYVSLAGVLWFVRPRARRLACAAAALCFVVLASAPFLAFRRPAAGWLRVSVLDVGQGEAVLVQTPDRRSLLVDAGGTPGGTFDVGGRIVTPAVWALGERGLDWLALTHGDLDHVGGAERVIEDLKPREVWEGIPVEQDPAVRQVRAFADRRGITWRRLLAGHEIESGGVSVVVRHPRQPDWQRLKVRNDDSLVLEVRYGDVSFLLTGDAGAEFESSPIEGPRDRARARIRILKVAHHGSRSSTRQEFLDHLRPRIAIVSAGASNLFGHPAPDVLARLAADRVHVFRTDRHGAVVIETDGREVRVRPVGGGRLDVS